MGGARAHPRLHMNSLPAALALSLRQLGDPAILKVLVKTTLITLAIFAALAVIGGYALDALFEGTGLFAGFEYTYLLTTIVAILAGWFLFRVVTLFVLQFFAEDVVRAVEAKHYPQAAHTVRDIPLGEEIDNASRSLLRTVLANAAALPVAGVLLVTGVGAPAVFWAVNAFLIGRELRDMVWLRHRADKGEIAPMGGLNRFLLGGAVVALLAIPFVNLLAPIIGAASATHMVHRAREKAPDA